MLLGHDHQGHAQCATWRRTLVVDLDGTLTIDDPARSYAEKLPYSYVWGAKVAARRREKATKSSSTPRAACSPTAATKPASWPTSAPPRSTGSSATNVPFHGLRSGKPFANEAFYVDDKAVRPSEFIALSEDELLKLGAQREERWAGHLAWM